MRRRGHFKRWDVRPAHPAATELARSLRVQPLVARLLCGRGLRGRAEAERFLHPALTHLHDPRELPGAVPAAERLVRALREREPVVIYGDYDVDGITAAAILHHVLKTADPAAEVRRYVPHRLEEGYGLSAAALQRLVEAGARVIVSVDCGITAREPARVARACGAELIITDHHELPAEGGLPEASVLVHPRLPADPPYPFGDLCGAGVAYKLAWQFARTWCGSERVSRTFRELLVDLLALAALGTVADVVPLVGENRAIARHGLQRIKHTPFVGLNALIDASRLRDERIDSDHVGYVLGPRLNACGRLGHARDAVKLLTDASPAEAQAIAARLNRVNQQRRTTQQGILREARRLVEQRGYDRDEVRAIVLEHEQWHPGVVGIACSRLVELYGRPAILLCTVNGEAQGSARSVDGFDLHAALHACRDHLDSYGGHAMAAGLRLPTARIGAFRQALLAHAAERLTVEDLTPTLRVDGEATLSELTPATVEQLQRLGPFGRSNPAPRLLVRGAGLTRPAQSMGREGGHLDLLAEQGGTAVRCVGWNMGTLSPKLGAGSSIDLVGRVQQNHFNGRRRVELVLDDLSW